MTISKKSIGIYNNYSYIISNKIGVKDKLNDKYYTNLYFFVLTLFCSFVFEYIRPIFIKSSVTDKYDIVAYCIGATAYIWWCKENHKKKG